MTVLPPHALRRAWVWAFWAVFSAFVGLGAVAVVWLGLKIGIAIVAAAAIIVLAGWIDRRIAAFGYRAWNRIARWFGTAAGYCVFWVCFLLIVIIGRTGTTLRLDRPAPNESIWEPRKPDSALPQHPQTASACIRWIEILRDAARGKDRWIIVLLPFLVLLAVFEADFPKDGPNGSTYALY